MEHKRLQTNVHVHPPPGLDLHVMHHVKYALPEQCDANVPKLLTKLREFLVAMLREVYDDVEVCRQIVAAKMQEWSMRIDPLFSYEHAQLLLHIRMWNIIGCYENGMAKQMEFIHWCRKLLSVLQRAARQLIMHWLMTFAQTASQRVDGIDKCATSKTRINRRVNTER